LPFYERWGEADYESFDNTGGNERNGEKKHNAVKKSFVGKKKRVDPWRNTRKRRDLTEKK